MNDLTTNLTKIEQIWTTLMARPEYSLLFLLIIAFVGVFTYAQLKKDSFDFRDSLLSKDGKVSLSKLGQLTSLVVSSWGFTYLVIHDKLTEYYYFLYMAVWAGSNSLNKYLATRLGTNPVPQDPPSDDSK